MRYFIRVVLALACLVGAFPVSADMVGQWQNQAGQIIEVRPDGQVKQVAHQGVAGLVQKVSKLFSQESQRVSNWEYAPAGQPLTGLQDKGLADQSDWTRERIWDKTAPLSDFKVAVYYRVTTEKSNEDKESISTRQEKQATVRQLSDTKSIEELSEEESEYQTDEQEVQIETVEVEEAQPVTPAQPNISAQVEEVVTDEEALATSSSLGWRRSRKSSNQPAQSESPSPSPSQAKSSKKTKDKQEQLPEAGESVNELLVMLGLLLLLGAGLVWKTSKKD